MAATLTIETIIETVREAVPTVAEATIHFGSDGILVAEGNRVLVDAFVPAGTPSVEVAAAADTLRGDFRDAGINPSVYYNTDDHRVVRVRGPIF